MSIRSKSVAKVLLAVLPLAGAPALADDAAEQVPPHERERRGSVLVELQPPALDASMYGVRLDISPTYDGPVSFGLVGRGGQWGNSVGVRTRFEGAELGEVKLNYAVGADARYTLVTLFNGTLRSFVGVTAGFEEFVARAGKGSLQNASTAAFLEPAVGVTWRPGAGRLGLVARGGPGFTFTDVRELRISTGELKLRQVYPTASLGLLVVL
ncbi:hypothetical protein LY474_32055 [Myxococcus stipitatus]|uniref:hypothetical protein n=1 Tax=Myxococcus stipitatus TaxID=83455 RepID=UPI001F2AA7C9|nr:hypothetical protein [Myxococcus stipitatus]MCE9672451.1 hypothetical protein [Myxococcus stipitatus]